MSGKIDPYPMLAWAACACALFIVYGSLLPFDFQPRSLAEIRHLFLTSEPVLVSRTDRLVNVIIALPLGFFAFGAWARPSRAARNWRAGFFVVALSVALAAGVEFLQLFLPTRSASYGDIVAQGIGAGAGIIGWVAFGKLAQTILNALLTKRPELPLVPGLSAFAKLAVLPYILSLLWLNGWFSGAWQSVAKATSQLEARQFLPFYYYYSASIFRSASSMVAVLIEYAPVGLLFCLAARPSRSPAKAASIGAALALLIEAGKLFLPQRHPDSTNVLLAALSSGATCALWPLVTAKRWPYFEAAFVNGNAPKPSSDSFSPRKLALRTLACVLFAAIALVALRYPLGSVWLAAALTLYTAALWRVPTLWLVVIPALLPCFDLAPWSGWFFLDEFDLFVLATIGTGLWLCAGRRPDVQLSLSMKILLLGLSISLLLSVLIGLLPLQPLDANAFANYYSRYNALRAAKGWVMALGLMPLLLANLAESTKVPRWLAGGMLVGLVTIIAAGFWERAVFPGLFDFAQNYRISALFSSMHTGDAPIETYLVTAIPFAFAWAHFHKTLASYAVASMVFVGATYVLLMTFSRGGYLAYVVGLAILVAGSFLTRGGQSEASKRTLLFLLLSSIAFGSIVGIFVLEGSFPRSRLARTEVDAVTRLGHWRNVLGMMEGDWLTPLAGMGLGRYPETDMKKNWSIKMPAAYSFIKEGENQFLRLSKGTPTYLEQIVNVEPSQKYVIALDLRSAPLPGTLNAMVCQRTFFRSYHCQDGGVWPSGTAGAWNHREVAIDSGALGSGPWFFRRPVKFILENTSADGAIDIDNVRMLDAHGANVIANGDFSQGHARWFFSSHDHLHWHIKNIWVQVWFEQGALGILFFALLVGFTIIAFARAALGGDFFYTALLASFAGFLCVGLFASPLDVPRLAFLFYLLALSGIFCAASAALPADSHAVAPDAKESRPARDSNFAAGRRSQPAARAVPRSPDQAGAPIWQPGRLRSLVLHLGCGMLVFVSATWLVMHSPWVPYNVRDLLHPVHPLLSLIVFALFLYWSMGLPVLSGHLMTQSRSAALGYPLLLLLHSALAWFVLTYAVSFDRIHKLVGSPVLHWHWYWEPAGRFIALFAALSLSLSGAVLLVLAFVYRRKSPAATLSWLITTAALSPFLYWIVVTKAATDNLVELMAGGGTPPGAFLLSMFVIIVTFGGASLAAQLPRIGDGIRSSAVLALLASIPLGYVAFALGSESALNKYGKVFSALQFLLSRDREHYAQGAELFVRYLIFHGGLIGAIAFVQYPFFSWLFSSRKRRRESDAVDSP